MYASARVYMRAQRDMYSLLNVYKIRYWDELLVGTMARQNIISSEQHGSTVSFPCTIRQHFMFSLC